MRRRHRKLIGAFTILFTVVVYSLAAMSLAQGRLQEADKIWQNLFYLVAGMGWILPLMPVIRWMERPDAK
jgi:hypothetical protein